MIAKDLSKQEVLDSHPKPMQQISFTENLARGLHANKTVFFIIEKTKETV